MDMAKKVATPTVPTSEAIVAHYGVQPKFGQSGTKTTFWSGWALFLVLSSLFLTFFAGWAIQIGGFSSVSLLLSQ